MLALDTAAYSSPWRRRHPAEKALLALGLLSCAVCLPPWPGGCLAGAVSAVAMLGPAGIAPSALLRVARAPLAFVAVGAVPLLVTVGGTGFVSWDPAGPRAAAELVARAVSCLLCLLLFATTTPLADVLPRLARIGVPPAVTEVAALIYRMLFLSLDTARAIREAQAARLGFRTWASTYRCLAGQAGAVLVQAMERARRMEEGLALRGYDGSLRVQVSDCRVQPGFVGTSLLVLALVLVVADPSGALW